MQLTKLNKEEVENTTYLKLVRNKTHFGPVSEKVVAKAKASALSAAANKIRLEADFKVSIKHDESESTRGNSNAISLLFGDIGNSETEIVTSAIYLMQAWDNLYKKEGTPSYMDKLAKALYARADAYKRLGINPNSGEKPNLTTDQRAIYNSVVGPTSFDYYEYHLAFKMVGQKKFSRSKTYRSLEPLDFKSMLIQLSREMARLESLITVIPRQSN